MTHLEAKKMTRTLDHTRWIAGLAGFAVLMALRSQLASPGTRTLVAALAFAWAGLLLLWFFNTRR
ncbi:MAG TPA: hypothetical protein VJV79_16695 [Polyangiaceae bacterium]|nr:hypothetical protein [Polyangiaceae bacterium]